MLPLAGVTKGCPLTQDSGSDGEHTMRFGSTAKVLLKCKLKYYKISECEQVPSYR